MTKRTSDTSKAAPSGTVAKPDSNASVTTKPKELKRNRPDSSEKASGLNSRKMPKRAAASSAIAEDEIAGISMTSGPNDPRPNRRLADFTFHIANGKPHPVEVLEVDDLFISGTILPLEESSGKGKEKGVRCEDFGRIESWTISGYEEGRPVIWVSTNIADYDCVQPANGYKRLYSLFFEKVVRSMSTSKTLPLEFPVREFIVSQGEFIYNQLIGLDGTPEKNERTFRDMPVLTALKDESKKQGYSVPPKVDARGGELAITTKENELPQAMLHNWSLYNSDSRLISLELLPMNPCANIDVTIFGSGIMRDDDGSGYFLDDDIQSSSSPGGVDTVDGMPIYLSAIKEWKIEFGSSMVSISIRTDMAWY
uniref:RFTS domain-containing protein n=1 Tax=Fagus sylvatica TaxID=28930 RepID=A0A2N9IIL5_FAGSY